MKDLIRPAAHCLLLAFAFAWPWDVYQYVPGLGFPLTQCVQAMVIVLWLADMAFKRTVQLPFELAWPAGAALVFVWAGGACRGDQLGAGAATGLLLFFAATAQLARSRGEIEQCLWFSAVSGACVAALTVLSRMGYIFPTAYSLATPDWSPGTFIGKLGLPFLAFTGDLSGGMLTLAICLVVALSFTVQRVLPVRTRRLAALYAFLLGFPLACTIPWAVHHISAWAPPGYRHWTVTRLGAAVVVVWLAARVAAKLAVARRLGPRPMHRAFLFIIATAAAWIIFLPVAPRAAHAFLLGLAAAYAFPRREPSQASDPSATAAQQSASLGIVPVFLLVPTLALVGLNLWRVFPDNLRDPRNYDAALRDDFATGQFDDARQRIALIERLAPGEPKTHWRRAELALSQGRPYGAAAEFAASLKRPGEPRTILPGPTVSEQEDFLVRLRDHCSSAPRPRSIFAYEKALVAAGDVTGALRALKVKTASAPPQAVRLERQALVRTAGFLLGLAAPTEILEAWSSQELLRLLLSWGAVVSQAPQGFPKTALPLLLAVQVGPGRAEALAVAGAHHRSASVAISQDIASDLRARWAWGEGRALQAGGPRGWTFPLMVKADETSHEFAVVRVSAAGELGLNVFPITPGGMPDSPALGIWIP